MPAYAYTGLDARGRTVKGISSADNVGALKAAMRRSGVYLTAATETTAASNASSGKEIDLAKLFDKVTPKMVAANTRLLATLLSAGVTLPESLAAIADQLESARFKGIMADIGEKVNQGSSLADAMGRYPKVFEDLYVNMIRAGEASGSLETVLLRLAEFMEKQLELRSKVTSAMLYPLILLVLGAGIVMVLMVSIVPKVTSMFEDMNAELPWNTRLLVFISDALSGYWYLFAAATAGIVALFRRWRASSEGRAKWDRFVLSLPIAGDVARKVAIVRFTRTLSTMLASGVQLLSALDIVRSLLGNVVLEKVVTQARDNIREGEGIAPALKRSGQFPSLVTHMIAVGERSGQLEQMLNDVANAYERETSTAIMRMTSMLEPLMIVFMGGSVFFIVISIMQPLMMLNEMAGR